MLYDSPGNTEALPPAIKQDWNDRIQRKFHENAAYNSRFFSIDPNAVSDPIEARPSWFGDPAEPLFCRNEDIARNLSDWGVRGRHAFHNEYCEYTVVYRIAPDGSTRPKRVTVTTELREYWVTLAMHDPDLLQIVAESVLGFQPTWQDLYAHQDPHALSPREREIHFSRQVAGHGFSSSLEDPATGQFIVPRQPIGALNRENALFMTHPINGLDDLLYIVMFGAHPYARLVNGVRQPATKEQIFRATHFGQENPPVQLACRHADPAAATAAHQQAYAGRQIAFANPLGMYINQFTDSVFTINDQPIPAEWIRFSRGRQRIEFGPGDNDSAFLDDIDVSEGSETKKVTGGYDVVKRIEVGPALLIGSESAVSDEEYIDLTESTDPISCSDASVCDFVRQVEDEYNNQTALVRNGPRRVFVEPDRG
ncbi:MAG: hypothetical protein R3F50_16590 [Gammaproteobacteria bacterium]